MNATKHAREPPEGVLAGESVPIENDRFDLETGLVDEAVKILQGRPAYADKSEAELREIAREKLEAN